MKHILLYTFLILATSFAATAQPTPGGPAPVITEIMYNPPEAGNDLLEFIEIFNPSLTAPISMGGFTLAPGVDFTFYPGFSLAPGAYVIIAGDSVAFENAFGVEAFEWQGATTQLNNSGEAVVLRNPIGGVMDSVNYDDVAPWPTSANGLGYSLGLCDATSNNSLSSNWTLSENATGIVVNSLEIFADPGMATTCTATGIADDNVITTLVYPNPTEGAFSMRFAPFEKVGNLTIHNSLGQMVYSQSISVGTTSVNVDLNLNSGYYILSLEAGGAVERSKLIVQ